jgi:hypothetical protein
MAERVIPWQDEQCPVIRRDPVQQFQRLFYIAGIFPCDSMIPFGFAVVPEV